MDLQTLALHAGYEKDTQGTMAVPIYMSTAYEFDNVEEAGDLFALNKDGNIYTRLSNPTTDIFEKKGFKKEDIEKALLETGDLKKAFDMLKKQL